VLSGHGQLVLGVVVTGMAVMGEVVIGVVVLRVVMIGVVVIRKVVTGVVVTGERVVLAGLDAVGMVDIVVFVLFVVIVVFVGVVVMIVLVYLSSPVNLRSCLGSGTLKTILPVTTSVETHNRKMVCICILDLITKLWFIVTCCLSWIQCDL